MKNPKYEKKAKRIQEDTGNEGQGEGGHKPRVQAGPTQGVESCLSAGDGASVRIWAHSSDFKEEDE